MKIKLICIRIDNNELKTTDENEWIENDNMENIVPVFLGYEVDKENAGIRIEIL